MDNKNRLGLKISNINEEILISGTKDDLKELIEYINMIINSKNETDHIHIDELTLISNNSNIKNLIIEKTK